MLPRSNASCDGVEPAPCFAIQNCQTHYSLRCPVYGTCQNNVVWSLFTSTTLAFRRRSKTPFVHGRTETPKASTQEFDPSCSGQSHSNRPCADPRNVDTERCRTLRVICVPCQVRPLGSADANSDKLCSRFRVAGTNGCLDFSLFLLAACGSVSCPCRMWPGSKKCD